MYIDTFLSELNNQIHADAILKNRIFIDLETNQVTFQKTTSFLISWDIDYGSENPLIIERHDIKYKYILEDLMAYERPNKLHETIKSLMAFLRILYSSEPKYIYRVKDSEILVIPTADADYISQVARVKGVSLLSSGLIKRFGQRIEVS